MLGAVAFVVGGLAGLGEGSDAGIGWTALGMAAVVLAVALLVPLGALVGLAQLLATAAYILLAPWEPIERPWTFVPVVGGVARCRLGDAPAGPAVGGRAGTSRRSSPPTPSPVSPCSPRSMPTRSSLTFALIGAVSIAIAVVLRRWPWAAAGAALVLVAGADAGHGWLALVLLVEGLALTVTGLAEGDGRSVGRCSDSAPCRWSVRGSTWRRGNRGRRRRCSTPLCRVRRRSPCWPRSGCGPAVVPRELAGVWAITGSAVASYAAGLSGDVAQRPGGLTLAGSLLLLAAAAAVTAKVLGGGMRWVAAALAAAAWLPAVWGLDPSATMATLVGTGVALAALSAALTLHGLRPGCGLAGSRVVLRRCDAGLGGDGGVVRCFPTTTS